MVSVAVVASRDVGSDIGTSERHGFAVKGVMITLQTILVATAAPLVTLGFEVILSGILDRVRAMTIGADRRAGISARQQSTMNALIVRFFHAHMAFATRLANIRMIDGRSLVHAPFDVMNSVTIIAGGSHNKPHLEKGSSMSAVRKLGYGQWLWHAVVARELLITVAPGTGLREIEFEHRRIRMLHRQDVMGTMTVHACRRSGGSNRLADAVDARSVLGGCRLMTIATLRGGHFVMDRVVNPAVAVRAEQFPVNRTKKQVGPDVQGNLPAANHLGQLRVFVTIKAFRYWKRCGGSPEAREQSRNQHPPSDARVPSFYSFHRPSRSFPQSFDPE